MKKENIIITDRRAFINAMRDIFIPSCNRLGISFNYGYAMNNWTEFWCWIDNDTLVSYELSESKYKPIV